jgi:hypothetical protein
MRIGLAFVINRLALRSQLALVRHPVFHQSRRYSIQLRCLVEEVLPDQSGLLKERTVGVSLSALLRHQHRPCGAEHRGAAALPAPD